jgi:hypothetical protein
MTSRPHSTERISSHNHRMAKTQKLTAARLRELASTGADVTLKRLRAEIIAIERAFPELRMSRGRQAVRRSLKAAATRTRKMSAAARKAVSTRMKRYWAERRKAQAKVK